MSEKPKVSTIKSIVQVVKDLNAARRVYETGLGLECAGEETAADFCGLKNARMSRFVRAGEKYGCVDLVENPAADRAIRDKARAWDYGILTLNYRTNNAREAVKLMESAGCEPVSEILSYNVGKPMEELMMNTPSGERLTIIQIGDATDEKPFFKEALATVGMVVPAMQAAKDFYTNVLGLEMAITFQAAGSPFDKLLGAPAGMSLDFATLTSDGNWTGKVELLELNVPNEAARLTTADGSDTGYWMFSMLCEDIDGLYESAREYVTVEPKTVERPFHGKVRQMILRAPGGELIEIIKVRNA
jgi:catechol 2,3-dioxygenase-like lactoylglutathione lyase family enzyme